jgi:DNA polymerase
VIDFFIDFETRSRVDLKKSGSVVYATDPSTEVTLITWCFGRTGHLKAWRPGQAIPQEIIDVALNPEKYRFIAQNVMFDYLIWTCVLSRLIPGLKRPIIEGIDDLMAISCHYRTGASLESIAAMLNLNLSKDKLGRQLMLKSCKPDSKGKFYELTPEEYTHFERYGIMDTRILREAYYMLPSLPAPERFAWEWTMKRNLRGICIDEALVNELDSIVQEAMPKLVGEFDYLVGFKCKMNSPVRCKEFFIQYYPYITGMGADIMREMLADKRQVPPHVRRALEIKELSGSTSISKIKSALSQKYMGRIYGILAYHFTQTKRWAGRGIQIQNFPRVDNSKADKLDFEMNVHDLASTVRLLRPGLKDPIGFVKNLLRRVWIPSPGKTFYCGDWAKVEPTVLFWLVGLGDIPKKWYEEMAAEIYGMSLADIGKDSEERQVGKTANLSCGYGSGWKSFKEKLHKDTGILLTDEMAKQVVWAYRNKYKEVSQFWTDLQAGFRKAIYGESSALCDGKVHIMPMQHPWKGVQIRLPSGSYLYYHGAKESLQEYEEEVTTTTGGVPHTFKVKKTRQALSYLADQGQGRIAYDYVYGGLLCENVCSAIGRDLIVPSIWRLENEGFEVLGSIHDELWAEAEEGRDKEFTQLMCVNPSWCDMKIEADLKVGRRYLK